MNQRCYPVKKKRIACAKFPEKRDESLLHCSTEYKTPGLHTYSRVSNSRGCTHLFFRGFSLTHALIGYLHDFQNSSLPRKIFAFGSIWKTFLTKNVNYGHFIHLHDFSNEKRQKKKKMFIHNTFYEFREFGCFRKIPRSTLIRYLHDLRFFMIFPHSRLLDLHGY